MPTTRSDGARYKGGRTLGILVAVVVVAMSLGVAACGGDDDDDTAATTNETTGTTGAAGASGEAVEMTATDFEFDPSDPTVNAGEVTFDVTNDGETVHNLAVEGPGGEAELPQNLQPGDSEQLTVDLSEPGTYRFYCPVGNHEELGMVGEVRVKG